MTCVSRCIPSLHVAGRQPAFKAPSAGLVSRRDCRVAAGYKARILSVNENETKEAKIKKLAEILHTSTETVSNIVAMRPGLLCPDSAYFEQRISALSYRYQVPPHVASQYALENPQLLFNRS